MFLKLSCSQTSLAVQWLGLRASNAGGMGSISGGGSSACSEVWPKKKKKLSCSSDLGFVALLSFSNYFYVCGIL